MVGAFLRLGYQNKLSNGWTCIYGYVKKDTIDKYKELYELSKDNKLEDNTIVYLTPLSEFPSYKLKNYIEENKLNITTARKLDKIDTLIINHDFITSSYLDEHKNKNYHIIPSEVILGDSYYQKYINHESYYQINTINGKPITHYFICEGEYRSLINLDSKFSIIKDYPLIECFPIENNWGNKKATDNIDFFLDLFNKIEKYNFRVIFDHNISDVVNEGLSIDEDVFENILNMITSQDESNISLAKEIIANMEFESSKPYLIYLFNYFYKLNQNNSNNKNYNYLKKQMKKYVHVHSTQNNSSTFNQVLPVLIKEYPKYSQEFMNCFRIHMNAILGKNVIKEIQTH